MTRFRRSIILVAAIASLLVSALPEAASLQWDNCTRPGEGPISEDIAEEFRQAYVQTKDIDLGSPVSGPYGCVHRWDGDGPWTQTFYGPAGTTNLMRNDEMGAVFRLFGRWLDKYQQWGGPDVLGAPSDNPTDRGSGREQYFTDGIEPGQEQDGGPIANAAMYHRPNEEVRIIHGDILDVYFDEGGTESWLGFPLADQENLENDPWYFNGQAFTEDRGPLYGVVQQAEFEFGRIIYYCPVIGAGPHVGEIEPYSQACRTQALAEGEEPPQ